MITTLENPTTTSSTLSTSLASPESSMSFRDSRHGFLGPTAYSAVFAENEGMGFEESTEVEDSAPIPPDRIQQGAEILSVLRDMPLFRKMTKRWFDVYDGLIILQPSFRIWYDDFWSEWQPVLTGGNPAQLLRLSEMIFRNTRKPFRTHGTMTAVEWSRAATGRSIRWEVIGIILSLIGMVSVVMNNWDSEIEDMMGTFVDRSTFAERIRKLSERCLCFCYVWQMTLELSIC